MSILKRWFGHSTPPPHLGTPSQLDGHADSRTTELGNHAATRRELIRVLARDSLRYAGIPNDWIECQVLLLPSRTGETFMHARLVVKHWDERLMRYAYAFQRRLMAEIERFEPNASDWLQSITWQYLADDECPYRELPDPASWTAKAPEPPARRAEPVPEPEVDDVQHDLRRLFAVRDAELAARANVTTSRDFQETQPERGLDFSPTEPGRL